MAGEEILQVFYAPHKAFKKIVQNAKFIGPIAILIIFVVVQVGASYVVASRSFLEQTMPTSDQGDAWTENAALWQASNGVAIADNHNDYINSSTLYYNTTSIEFTASNTTSIQMFLNSFPASVNCGVDGFKNLSLRVKIVSPSVVPQNVTLYLFSLSPANYFSYDLTPMFSNTTVVEQQFWNNLTVPVGAGNGASSNSAASWDNITGLRMDFIWAANSNIDVRVDGLFFRGVFKNSLEVYGSSVLLSTALSAATPFLFEWLLLTAIIWLLIKGLKGNAIWKLVMVSVAFALATLIVQSVVLLVVYSTSLPNISYPLEILANIPGEADVAYAAVQAGIGQVLLIGSALQIVIYVWIVALGTFIVREVTSVAPPTPLGTPASTSEGEPAIAPQPFGWPKALLISAASLVLTVTILGFLGIA